jgi:hypothetical protein
MRVFLLQAALVIAASAGFSGCATASQDQELSGGLFGPAFSPAEMEKKIAAAQAHPLGSEANPVRASMPPGERAYIARLRCSNGQAPEIVSRGSTGTGPFGNILDLYSLRCAAGTPATAEIYIDMYHDHVETQAVPGFAIVAP